MTPEEVEGQRIQLHVHSFCAEVKMQEGCEEVFLVESCSLLLGIYTAAPRSRDRAEGGERREWA